MELPCSIISCVTIIVVVLCVCLCGGLIAGVVLFADGTPSFEFNLDQWDSVVPEPTEVVEVERPVVDPLLSNDLTAMKETLENTIVPENDPRELAMRLTGIQDIPETLPAPETPYRVGDSKLFWVGDVDTLENSRVDATLRYITDHSYFWIESGLNYNEDDLTALAEEFEDHIYPTVRAFFGSEWRPGVDNDPHLYILYAKNLGYNIAGYFDSSAEYDSAVNEYSNGHEMFFLSADNTELYEDFTYGVLAHEFQHMIHWYQDANEETWLNEGFSELAAYLTGYDEGSMDYLYVSRPDMQLTYWPEDGDTGIYYGGAFLFVNYFLERFGDTATQQLVGHANNGMTSIDELLGEIAPVDVLRDTVPTADDVFQDFTIANYLHEENLADGRFGYTNYKDAPQTGFTEEVETCPLESETRSVHQYGVDYIKITCEGDHEIVFEGSTVVQVVPEDPHSGDYAFWSNRGDTSNMSLTQTFDFTDVSGAIDFSYWLWYEIEIDYDYLYLLASTDGANWEFIQTPSGTDTDPSGNSYGWGYNGRTQKWIQETVDLSAYAGQKVTLRFEYVTDAAVNGEGLLLDDVSIPAIGYASDFETDDGGWEADGFVRLWNQLPQTFRLALIEMGRETKVTYIDTDTDNMARIPFTIDNLTKEVVLVVSAVTDFTNQTVGYQFAVE